MNRDTAIAYLNDINKKAHEKINCGFTRLYYLDDNGEKHFVEDYSFFANEKYMCKELLDALSKGKTLSSRLQKELDTFVIETTLIGSSNAGIIVSDPKSKENVLLDQLLEKTTVTTQSIKVLQESWDKVKEETKQMSFQEFGTEALHRLQRQFLNTPDTKDTVLTRMNIIQMIKDLKELGLK